MKWTVGTKLSAAFGALVVVLVALAAYGAARDQKLERAMATIYDRGVVSTQALGRASALMERIRGRHFFHAASDDEREMDHIEEEIRRLDVEVGRALDAAEATYEANDPRRAALGHVRDLRQTWARRREQELYPVSRRRDVAASTRVVLTRLAPLSQEVLDALGAATDQNVARTAQVYRDARDVLRDARRLSLWTTGLAAALALVLGWLLARSISYRLAAVAAVAGAVGRGERDPRPPGAGTDHIKHLATHI
jgi:methyl-accepting chemotaxis protein